jgi:hypothetical protein
VQSCPLPWSHRSQRCCRQPYIVIGGDCYFERRTPLISLPAFKRVTIHMCCGLTSAGSKAQPLRSASLHLAGTDASVVRLHILQNLTSIAHSLKTLLGSRDSKNRLADVTDLLASNAILAILVRCWLPYPSIQTGLAKDVQNVAADLYRQAQQRVGLFVLIWPALEGFRVLGF